MKNIIKFGVPIILLLGIYISGIYLFDSPSDVVVGLYNNSDKKEFDTNYTLAIMYENDNGEYVESTSSNWLGDGYTFNENLSKCKNGSKIYYDNATKKVMVEANTNDRCYVYFDAYSPNFVEYLLENVYVSDGVNGLYYHDGVGSYTNANQEAGDNSYRYSGADPNNYVCFGSDAATCPSDNLYRIIGVFGNEVKLIKSTSYGSYAWDSGGSNTWDATTKPDIYTTLNDTYYNSLGTTWQNKVADAIWQVGGLPNTYYNSSLKTNYDYEVGVYQTGYEETMKIGLMYVSDYVYASSSNNWTASLYDYGNSTDPNEGWLYLGTTERTISCVSGRSDYTWSVGSSGSMFNASYVIGVYAIRPVFYLNSSISYVSGSGSSTDPIRIS